MTPVRASNHRRDEAADHIDYVLDWNLSAIARPTYDAQADREVHFLVMVDIAGETLAELVERRGPLPVAVAAGLLAQAAWPTRTSRGSFTGTSSRGT